MADSIFMLVCEDASHLGGPMGSEYTTHVFSKAFKTVDAAKEYAMSWYLKHYKRAWTKKWQKHDYPWNKRPYYSADTGGHIWTIREQSLGD